MPDFPDAEYRTIAPDWACEVFSPSIRLIDLNEKRKISARERVAHLWFVESDARKLEGLRFSTVSRRFWSLLRMTPRSGCHLSTPSISRLMRSGREAPQQMVARPDTVLMI